MEATVQVIFDVIFDAICLGGGAVCACLYLLKWRKKKEDPALNVDDADKE